MRIPAFLLLPLVLWIVAACSSGNQGQSEPRTEVDAILQGLSLEQKIGQMAQLNIEVFINRQDGKLPHPIRLDTAKLVEAIQKRGIGSIMNTAGQAMELEDWHYITETIEYVQEQGGKIPIIYAIDAVHGTNYVAGSTLFPHQLGMAATWNDSLVRRMGEVTALESRAAGIPWIFSPILDVARQPLWVQFFETFGEDSYLAQRMGTAITLGYQESEWPVAACAKHFVGYGFPFTGKDRTPVQIGERALRELHVPAFEASIHQGLRSIMIGSNELDGVPMLASEYWVNEVLRKEIGFDGVLLSDWADVAHLSDWHRVAKDTLEATRMAIEAGLDMAMIPNDYSFCDDLLRLVKDSMISESRIDASVRRILQLKWEMGLFDEINRPKMDAFATKENSDEAYEAAVEGITLLKNESDILPIDPAERIFVTGPTAHSLVHLNGAWSRTWQGADTVIGKEGRPSVLEAMRASNPDLIYLEGSSVEEVGDLDRVRSEAKVASVIVLCLGETPATEKPGDRRDLTISDAQLALANAVLDLGKPVVLVLLQDRPQIVASIADRCAAVVMGYRPGNEGGRALADLLFGKRNFSGRLPFTYPSSVNDLMTYDHKFAETIGPDWGPTGFQPQWEFGYGLSYTRFEYEGLSLNKMAYSIDDTIQVSMHVKNVGGRDGNEVVQVYVRDEIASITPSVKRLRDFKKIGLQAGEEEEMHFSIPVRALAFVGLDNAWTTEPGWFTLKVGDLEERFEVID